MIAQLDERWAAGCATKGLGVEGGALSRSAVWKALMALANGGDVTLAAAAIDAFFASEDDWIRKKGYDLSAFKARMKGMLLDVVEVRARDRHARAAAKVQADTRALLGPTVARIAPKKKAETHRVIAELPQEELERRRMEALRALNSEDPK